MTKTPKAEAEKQDVRCHSCGLERCSNWGVSLHDSCHAFTTEAGERCHGHFKPVITKPAPKGGVDKEIETDEQGHAVYPEADKVRGLLMKLAENPLDEATHKNCCGAIGILLNRREASVRELALVEIRARVEKALPKPTHHIGSGLYDRHDNNQCDACFGIQEARAAVLDAISPANGGGLSE